MSEAPEIIESEAHEVELHAPTPPATLFRTDDPALVVKRASEAANVLRDVIRKQRLAVKIQGRWHITVEGWQTLGAMLGVTPVCEWTRPMDGGWEARVIAQTLDGRAIGAAESECLRSEGRWDKADDYAIRSMAQTRATSKALASVLRFVATLAGYDGTPAEEAGQQQASAAERIDQRQAQAAERIDQRQAQALMDRIMKMREDGVKFSEIAQLFGAAGIDAPDKQSVKSVRLRVEALTPAQADALERELEGDEA